MGPTEIDVNSINYVDANGNPLPTTGTSGSGGGTSDGNIWGSIIGGITGIIGSLFPNGVGGSGNAPVLTTTPNGNTSVQLQSSSNFLMYALLGGILFFLVTGQNKTKK